MAFADAAVTLGSSVVKLACRIWVGPSTDTLDELVDFVRDHVHDRLEQRRLNRFFEECVDTVAANLIKLFEQNSRQLPDDEFEAIVAAVGKTLTTGLTSELDIVAADLDSRVVERSLQAARDATLNHLGLTERGEGFYRLLLRESCAYTVEMVTTLPTFQPGVFGELLRRTTSILDVLDRVIERLPARRGVEDFDADYRRLVTNKFDRLELYGAPASTETMRRYPLSTAYISLGAVSKSYTPYDSDRLPSYPDIQSSRSDLFLGGLRRIAFHELIQPGVLQLLPEDDQTRTLWPWINGLDSRLTFRTPLFDDLASQLRLRAGDLNDFELVQESAVAGEATVEDILANQSRMILIGEAGSGKTTLLHWLAVRCARSDFEGPMSQWNGLVPFFIPLRRFADGALPQPSEFLRGVTQHIADEMPVNWVHDHLRSGRALVLIDGIDELREGGPREAAREWLRDLVVTFPHARYVVTSRPPAAQDEWRSWMEFSTAEMRPMSLSKIRLFIQRWHETMRLELATREDRDRLDGDQVALLALIESDRHLRALCVNPLLCALLCALNRVKHRQLPRNRMGVYREALEMLLDLRDRERQIADGTSLNFDQKQVVLQDLALFLVRNALTDASTDRVIEQIGRSLRTLRDIADTPNAVLRSLLERSGILRQPSVGSVDFIHRTFQEYLAAKAAVENDELGFLCKHAEDDQLRDVIIMAVGHAQPRQRAELLQGLISAANDIPMEDMSNRQSKLRLMIVASLQNAPQLDPDLRRTIELLATEMLPPESVDVAPYLAAAGDVVLDLLTERPPQNTQQARAAVRVATLIGGPDAMASIASIAGVHDGIDDELARAWTSFDPETYAREVLSKVAGASVDTVRRNLTVTDLTFMPYLHYLTWLTGLTISAPGLSSLAGLPSTPANLQRLCLTQSSLRDLTGIDEWSHLTHFDFEMHRATMKLTPLAHLEHLVALRIRCPDAELIDLTPLAKLKTLTVLQIGQPAAKFIKLHPLAKMTDVTIFVPPGVTVIGRENLGARSTVQRADEFPPL